MPTLEGLDPRQLLSGPGHALIASAPLAVPRATRGWVSRAPLPEGRSEVAAGRVGADVVVVGGALPTGATTAQVEAYSPRLNRWRTLPDLPIAVNHASAASDGNRLFVLGGYAGNPSPATITTAGFVLVKGTWRSLPAMPEGRAAAGAAVVGNRLYVVGGVTPHGLAAQALVYQLRTGQWSVIPGPTPREHLGVATDGRRIFAIGGRTAGFDSNLAVVEAYRPGSSTWTTLPSVPDARAGTGAAVVDGRLISVGGEQPEGTIATAYAYQINRRRWTRLPDLPTPRHGLGVVAFGNRVFVVAGGDRTGGGASTANESIRVG